MGKYKKKLYKTFIIASITLVSIVMFVVSFSFFKNQKNQYINTVRQSSITKSNSSDFAINVITKAISDFIQTPEIEEWATTKNRSAYYHNSVKVYEKLRKITTNLSLVDYELSVATLDDYSSVISQSGTIDKEAFFKDETSLSNSQVDYILHYFKYNSTPLTVSSYNENRLQEIYYIVKQLYDDTTVLFFAKIPYETLFGKDYEQQFIVYNSDENKIIALNGIDTSQNELNNYLITNLEEAGREGELSHYQDLLIYSASLNTIDWKIGYIYENISLNFSKIFLYIVTPFLFLLLLSLLISKTITERLYKPIKEVISEIAPEDEVNPSIDEFKLLKQNTHKIFTLSEQLKATIAEKDLLVSQKFYRGLLLGSEVDPKLYEDFKYKDKDFCVAIVEFQNSSNAFADDQIFFYKNNMYSATLKYENIQYINISHNTCAIIIQTSALANAKKIVLDVIETINELVDIKVSISDVKNGVDSINSSFNEAIKILEYKNLYVKSEILTLEDVEDLVDTTYYYPLLTENRLIQSMIEGKEEAIEIFDDLIRENIQHRNLSSYTLKNFIFVLVGTLNRAFQELKTTPEDFLGENIDFEHLYNSWDNVNIIHQMKKIIQGIIDEVNAKNESMDDTLLTEMQEYIYENYSDDIMLNDMAAHFNISPKYCSALFKKLSDDTFRNFLNRYRIDKAKEFLEKDPDLKINDLSTMVGFNSSSSFIRVFGKYVGVTPKAFAEKIIKDNEKSTN